MNRKSALGWVVAVAVVVALAAPAVADDKAVTGRFKCVGTNPDGQQYEGVVEVKRDGDSYTVSWSIGNGNDTYSGIGLLQGDVFSVAYAGGISGIAVYKVEKGKLTGRWATPDAKGKVFTETWTR
jgi:hypothetical protein